MNIRLLPFQLPFTLPPTELLIIESLFLLVVFICCAVIFYRTYSVFQLTEHKGIKYFRSIFLHFGLAYFFRLVHFFLLGLRDFTNIPAPEILLNINLFFVSYFSTMALFSLFMTILYKFKKIDSHVPHVTIHVVSVLFAVFFAVTNSLISLVIFQTLLIILCVLLFPIAYLRGSRKGLFNQNNITYLLLIVFWALSLVAFSGRLIPFVGKVIFYIFSAAIFLWITQRVTRRLSFNGKKTR
jgi:hypothetical protein